MNWKTLKKPIEKKFDCEFCSRKKDERSSGTDRYIHFTRRICVWIFELKYARYPHSLIIRQDNETLFRCDGHSKDEIYEKALEFLQKENEFQK